MESVPGPEWQPLAGSGRLMGEPRPRSVAERLRGCMSCLVVLGILGVIGVVLVAISQF